MPAARSAVSPAYVFEGDLDVVLLVVEDRVRVHADAGRQLLHVVPQVVRQDHLLAEGRTVQPAG